MENTQSSEQQSLREEGADTSRSFQHQLETEPYLTQVQRWPKSGQFILAQYTDEGILVYQAFRPEIGRYAVKHQRFTGCEEYSLTRMTWIKTNFLWMMFRNGWGEKKSQQMTLGIWLKRSAFDRYLSIAAKRNEADRRGAIIRLQWDPDHDPSGAPVKRRRAIQLGLKNMLSFANGYDILRIDDMTEFVANCARGDLTKLITPKEVVYEVHDPATITNLGLSHEAKEGESEEEPLRLTLCYKERRKVVLLQPCTMFQLSALAVQKFGVKVNFVTDSKGNAVLDDELKALGQDAVLHIS
jgi:hypothetical protein